MVDEWIKQLVKEEVTKSGGVPVGAIFAFPSETIPVGYLPCEGQELAISQYPELFKLIGRTYGGTSKTFNLPDLQGQFIRGLDREGNVDVEESGRLRKIGSPQEDSLQGHRHSIPSMVTNDGGAHDHTVFYSYKTLNSWGNTEVNSLFGNNKYSSSNSGSHSHTIPETETGGIENHTYGKVRVDSETRPVNIAFIYCIKVE